MGVVGPLFTELIRQRTKVRDDVGGELPEQGQELVADAGAQEAGIVVGRVLGKSDGMPGEVGEDGLPGSPEEGPHEA